MSCQLPADCLNEIFEHLNEDKAALLSCALVNRLCCQIAIRILWRNIWSIQRFKPPSSIISTLVACLPDESKEVIYNNGIVISPPTLKSPMFNYAAFVKEISISDIDYMIDTVLKSQQSLHSESQRYAVLEEIMKMFMIQIPSLNILDCIYFEIFPNFMPDMPFAYSPGATNCLTNLSELRCSTSNSPEFFNHLVQICFNIKYLTIHFESIIPSSLIDLISSQRNLKHLKLFQAYDGCYWTDIIPSLTKHSMTLTKLNLISTAQNVPISFISLCSNLQELSIKFYEEGYFNDFRKLQYITFPNLQILKIPYQYPEPEHLMKFLENNGKNLTVLKIGTNDSTLNLSIARFCPNIKKLFLLLKNDELETLKFIFNTCKYLESIKVWCGKFTNQYLKEKEVLKLIAECSPSNFYELKLYNVDSTSNLFPEDLDSFLTSWKNRVPLKPLSLLICCEDFFYRDEYKEIKNIIEKYENLGIIKQFEAKQD